MEGNLYNCFIDIMAFCILPPHSMRMTSGATTGASPPDCALQVTTRTGAFFFRYIKQLLIVQDPLQSWIIHCAHSTARRSIVVSRKVYRR